MQSYPTWKAYECSYISYIEGCLSMMIWGVAPGIKQHGFWFPSYAITSSSRSYARSSAVVAHRLGILILLTRFANIWWLNIAHLTSATQKLLHTTNIWWAGWSGLKPIHQNHMCWRYDLCHPRLPRDAQSVDDLWKACSITASRESGHPNPEPLPKWTVALINIPLVKSCQIVSQKQDWLKLYNPSVIVTALQLSVASCHYEMPKHDLLSLQIKRWVERLPAHKYCFSSV